MNETAKEDLKQTDKMIIALNLWVLFTDYNRNPKAKV